jgi:hypothetical protein
MIEPHCLINDTMLRGDRFRPLSQVGENVSSGGRNGFFGTGPNGRRLLKSLAGL